jgi:hypothetical protein
MPPSRSRQIVLWVEEQVHAWLLIATLGLAIYTVGRVATDRANMWALAPAVVTSGIPGILLLAAGILRCALTRRWSRLAIAGWVVAGLGAAVAVPLERCHFVMDGIDWVHQGNPPPDTRCCHFLKWAAACTDVDRR